MRKAADSLRERLLILARSAVNGVVGGRGKRHQIDRIVCLGRFFVEGKKKIQNSDPGIHEIHMGRLWTGCGVDFPGESSSVGRPPKIQI